MEFELVDHGIELSHKNHLIQQCKTIKCYPFLNNSTIFLDRLSFRISKIKSVIANKSSMEYFDVYIPVKLRLRNIVVVSKKIFKNLVNNNGRFEMSVKLELVKLQCEIEMHQSIQPKIWNSLTNPYKRVDNLESTAFIYFVH